MSEPSIERVGDAERSAAADLLGEHMSAGRLDHAEHADRVERALRARTAADLDVLFADLPGGRRRPATALTTPTSGHQIDWSKVATIASSVAWPVWIILMFAIGWEYWWLVFIPALLIPALAGGHKKDADCLTGQDDQKAIDGQDGSGTDTPALEQGTQEQTYRVYEHPVEKNPDDLR